MHLDFLPIKEILSCERVLVIQSHSYVKLMDTSFQCLIRRNQVFVCFDAYVPTSNGNRF
jgi:hypothetical protein